jgi:adenylyltransferase/sulfurtransferase
LPESRLVPLDELPARVDDVRTAPGTLVVAYCHHGIRSLQAAAILEHAGVAGVVSLAGGIDAWAQVVAPHLPRY